MLQCARGSEKATCRKCSSSTVGSQDHIKVVGLGNKHLCLLSHLNDQRHFLRPVT